MIYGSIFILLNVIPALYCGVHMSSVKHNNWKDFNLPHVTLYSLKHLYHWTAAIQCFIKKKKGYVKTPHQTLIIIPQLSIIPLTHS